MATEGSKKRGRGTIKEVAAFFSRDRNVASPLGITTEGTRHSCRVREDCPPQPKGTRHSCRVVSVSAAGRNAHDSFRAASPPRPSLNMVVTILSYATGMSRPLWHRALIRQPLRRTIPRSEGIHQPRSESSNGKMRMPSGAQLRLNACVKKRRRNVWSVFATSAR